MELSPEENTRFNRATAKIGEVLGICQDEAHWSVRFTKLLFVSCACCLLTRGIVVGFLLATILWVPLWVLT